MGGESASLVVATKMAGAHALILDEVQQVREKHQDILRLEASINELTQMFQEMALLVDSQGELLDAIEVHVSRAKACTGKVEQELVKAKKGQNKYHKYMCCTVITVAALGLFLTGPMLIYN